MEQAVTERRFSQEKQVSQLQIRRNGALDRRGTHFQEDPSQSRDSQRCIGWDRTNMSYGSINGGNKKEKGHAPISRDIRDCRSRSPRRKFQSGRCYWGSPYVHSEVTKYNDNNVGDSSRRSLIKECHTRSPCHNFHSGRCFRGSTCPYLHSEFINSERTMHDWDGEQHHGIGVALRNPGSREGNVDTNFRTSWVHDESNNENKLRAASFSRDSRSRSPFRNFLKGRYHLGASSRSWHPVNAYNHDLSAEQQPRIAGASNIYGFGDGHSVMSSREHGLANQQINLMSGSSGEPRNRPPSQYFLKGSSCQDVPSVTLQPATFYENTGYHFGTQHRRGATATSTNLRFDIGNVVREDNFHEVQPSQAVHVGSVPWNDVGVNAHHKVWTTKEQFVGDRDVASRSWSSGRKRSRLASNYGGDQLKPEVCPKFSKGWTTKKKFICDRDVASGSWSSERRRSRPASNFGGNQLKREVCLKFTEGRCNKGENCRYMHSFHEYPSSISQKLHVEAAAVPMSIGRAATMVTQEHDTFRNDKMQDCRHTESILVCTDYCFDKEIKGQSADDVKSRTNALQCNHADQKTEELVSDSLTVAISEATASNQEPVELYLTSSISPGNTTMVVLKKDEAANVKVDLNHDVNEKLDETNHILKTTAVVLEKDKIVGVNINCEANEKPEETNPIVKTYSGKRRKHRSSSSICGVESMMKEMTGTSSQKLKIDSMAGTSLDDESVVSVSRVIDDISASVPKSDVIRAVLKINHPIESDLTSSCEKYHNSSSKTTQVVLEKDETTGVNFKLTHEVNEKPKETKHLLNTTTVVVEKLEMAGVNIDVNHEVNEKPEVTKRTVETCSKKRRRRQRSRSRKRGVESMTKELTNISSQRLPISSLAGSSLNHESVVSVSGVTDDVRTGVPETGVNVDMRHEVNEKPEETKHIRDTTMVVLEKDEMTGMTIDLSNKVSEKPEETKHIVKNNCKRRSKRRSRSSKCVVESKNATSSRLLPISSMQGTSLDHKIVVSVSGVTDIGTNVPKTDAFRFVLANGHPVDSDLTSACEKYRISPANPTIVVLQKDETAGVNVDQSHKVNEKPEETKHTLKRKRKRRRSSKCVVESMHEEVTDTSSQRLPIGYMGGTVDHESVVSASAVIDEISTSVSKIDVIRTVLANDHPVEEQANDLQNTVESMLAVREEGMLLSNTDHSSFQVSRPSDTAILKSRRKLLVLDVNGLLADIVADFPDRFKPNFRLAGKGVFKRPFCDAFLQFCFEKFDVGIWSSRTKKNVTRVLDFLMKKTKNKLLFCWHHSHCTKTGYKTLENNEKPLVLKELKKLWENKENDLPWQRGFYNESNTILLDDSPYKALRNPPYTAVYPLPYSCKNVEDKSLGPDGDLRLYLERLAEAENVQKFIQANPFGQRPITKANLSWNFYSKIAGKYANQQDKGISRTVSGHVSS